MTIAEVWEKWQAREIILPLTFGDAYDSAQDIMLIDCWAAIKQHVEARCVWMHLAENTWRCPCFGGTLFASTSEDFAVCPYCERKIVREESAE